MIRNLANCLLVLSLGACSSSEIVTLPIDPTPAMSFADRVKKRFADYAEASGYQYPKPPDPNIRDGGGEPIIAYRGRGSKEEVVGTCPTLS